ncbi:MAG: polysaccharide biosynthesis protein [Fimbriimonadaceae bacterium]
MKTRDRTERPDLSGDVVPAYFRRFVLDLFFIGLALITSLALVLDSQAESLTAIVGRIAVPSFAVACSMIWWRKLYRINSRYVSVVDLLNVGYVALATSATACLAEIGFGRGDFERLGWAFPVLFGLQILVFLAAWRVAHRTWGLRKALSTAKVGVGPRRTLVVGTGDAAETVLRELSRRAGPFHVIGLLDDDDENRGTTIHGVPVLGTIDTLPQVARYYSVDDILIALPEAAGEEMRRVFSLCAQIRARVRTLPSFDTVMQSGGTLINQIRELEPEDLLKRDSVATDLQKTAEYVSGQRVLVTGGGGSIGSELVRQVGSLAPSSLVILGKGEGSIFEIDQEMRRGKTFLPTSVVADVRDRQGMRRVCETYLPGVVFHAAAHKHVPLMESVPIEAIRNNVFGTLVAAEESVRAGVDKFILVSTDKAVNPQNVMGATKRVAEMVVGALAGRSDTHFGIVRFGNVLGSRGSLVPLLRKQIEAGGPVTITHPDMTRFFMTIPEAAQLIIQAGAMADKGEIFILDMGEPVKIVDLAMDMIRMHGLVPGQDIEIKYTGVRPGEKIQEELASKSEQLLASRIDKIRMVANPPSLDWDALKPLLEQLREICDSGKEEEARQFLMELAWGKATPLPTRAVTRRSAGELEQRA